MLGKTAGGLFWMFRYLERSENIARLLEAGFRIALTRAESSEDEWTSLITTSGVRDAYLERHEEVNAASVIDFLLRDKTNPSSVINLMDAARNNARTARTALTREVWEAVNESWLALSDRLRHQVRERDLPAVLGDIRRQSGQVRGAMHGTMLRHDSFDFSRLGTFIERADSTARILDVKYYVLLPSSASVGGSLDNVQWETILRSVSAHRSYNWLHGGEISAASIADFLILDRRLPRSLAFCYGEITANLAYLEREYGESQPCREMAQSINDRLKAGGIEEVFSLGLHEFLDTFVSDTAALGQQIETDYRFYG